MRRNATGPRNQRDGGGAAAAGCCGLRAVSLAARTIHVLSRTVRFGSAFISVRTSRENTFGGGGGEQQSVDKSRE